MSIRRTTVCILLTWLPAALALGPAVARGAENLVANGGFEQGLQGWSRFWSRTAEGKAALDPAVRHEGRQSVRVEHPGAQDWSLSQQNRLAVRPGEIYELAAWVRLEGDGEATASVTLYGAESKVLDWSFGGRSTRAAPDWRLLRSRFIVPDGATAILPRLIGHGPATVWCDDFTLSRVGTLDALRSKDLAPAVNLANPAVEVTFHTGEGSLSVLDRRTGRQWRQRPGVGLVVLGAKREEMAAGRERGLSLRLLDPSNMLEIEAALRLDAVRPEVVVELKGSGELNAPLAFPPPFASRKEDLLILPVNEGISYPAADETLKPMSYHLYGGHGLCMGWWGATDGGPGWMAIVETPDDAAVRIPRIDGLLCLAPEWQAQKGQFGPARRIRYVFFDQGGYVAMCKRYRQHAQHVGLLKTLAEKRAENPNVDLLVGAVNVWCFGKDGPSTCREMQSLGIRRILWSSRQKPEQIRQLNEMGVLTSRYDIYQDLMDPANLPKLRGLHSDWTQEGWPKDIILGPDGRWIRGWGVKGKDDQWYSCGVLCDRQALAYARRRIPAELKTHEYRCRFIDTTTASPWRECYHPDHPMTRSESRKFKMDLLEYVSHDCRLVTGSETGHEAAVPYVHYFEGMLSLGPYRVPDSGRAMLDVVHEVPERVAKFQTGHFYRLPLWELVYHDCVVAQWYWGDYNNKLPALWDRRDLWNALYGTPPMFMFNGEIWKANRQRFVQSYQTATPVARATGYCEMLSHRWLTEDHAVQETRFANGVTVTVNFGEKPFSMQDGSTLGPLSHRVEGIDGAAAGK